MNSRATPVEDTLVWHLIDILEDWPSISCTPLFGAIALRRGGIVFAMSWENALYFKVDGSTIQDYRDMGSHALPYMSKGKMLRLKSFWQVPAEVIEDDDHLRLFAEDAWRAALGASDKSNCANGEP